MFLVNTGILYYALSLFEPGTIEGKTFTKITRTEELPPEIPEPRDISLEIPLPASLIPNPFKFGRIMGFVFGTSPPYVLGYFGNNLISHG